MDTQLEQITYRDDGDPVAADMLVAIPQVSETAYTERLREISNTYQIIHDNHSGRAFEMAIVNADKLKNGAILIPSTMFSSLTQNRGNAIELAAHGAANPDMARVYIAFPGMGGSDDLSGSDRRYLAQSGRFTHYDRAVDSLAALARALDARDIPIKCISADAEGGRLGLGMMAALPADTITTAYLNGLPGISPTYASYITLMMREDREGQSARTVEDRAEPFRVSDRTLMDAKPLLANIYESRRHVGKLVWTYVRALPNMMAYISAFSQYNDLDATNSHAALQDTIRALKRQPRARVTFQFGRLSALHSIMQCRRFGQLVTQELGGRPTHGGVQLFIHDGSLDFHTIYPSRRWAAERAALTTA